jgi:hypothetical protein
MRRADYDIGTTTALSASRAALRRLAAENVATMQKHGAGLGVLSELVRCASLVFPK